MDEGLAENLAALATLDYPDYELLVAVREATDLPSSVLPSRARLVVAGANVGDIGTSHKITNLLAAVDVARPESTVFAFADSDGRPGKLWLRALAAQLRDQQVGAATAYRWYVPQPPNFWSNVRAAWNATVAGTLGPGDNAFCWGGAMAVTRVGFESMQVRDHWKGQVSDDFQLAQAAHDAGLRVAFAPGAIVPCVDHAGADFLGWARRQLIITRHYAPKLWWQALIGHAVYVGGMAAGIYAAFHLGARGLLAYLPALLIILLGMRKAGQRAELVETVHPEQPSQVAIHLNWVTLATFVWLGLLLASAFANSITWRGIRYNLQRRH
jgi:cellulose synthase/poly-beta-1,6-N-acetylglucosamine synthase-like glycosyltransferase